MVRQKVKGTPYIPDLKGRGFTALPIMISQSVYVRSWQLSQCDVAIQDHLPYFLLDD